MDRKWLVEVLCAVSETASISYQTRMVRLDGFAFKCIPSGRQAGYVCIYIYIPLPAFICIRYLQISGDLFGPTILGLSISDQRSPPPLFAPIKSIFLTAVHLDLRLISKDCIFVSLNLLPPFFHQPPPTPPLLFDHIPPSHLHSRNHYTHPQPSNNVGHRIHASRRSCVANILPRVLVYLEYLLLHAVMQLW